MYENVFLHRRKLTIVIAIRTHPRTLINIIAVFIIILTIYSIIFRYFKSSKINRYELNLFIFTNICLFYPVRGTKVKAGVNWLQNGLVQVFGIDKYTMITPCNMEYCVTLQQSLAQNVVVGPAHLSKEWWVDFF